mgnify:FL=1
MVDKEIQRMNTAVIVPTLNAGLTWEYWIKALLSTGVNAHDVYVVDSGSTDNTVQLATKAEFNVRQIEPGTFNHGGTRQEAVTRLAGYDIVVFLTQDAILHDAESIRNIISYFESDQVCAVCGRQLPGQNAGAIEAHARLFNYPDTSSTSSISDAREKGLKAVFLSNSFAAYRVSALLETGGFPANVIFGEDMYVAARMLKAGYKIAYAADACVYHSHNYSLIQEMKRYFDMGVFHAREPWIRQQFGTAESEGLRFVVSEIKYLSRHALWRIPEGILRTILKYAGFRLGLGERHIPMKIKRKISMNPRYFKI